MGILIPDMDMPENCWDANEISLFNQLKEVTMKNYMTVKQLMICAEMLHNEADSYGRIAAESRANLEAIWNMPADARTDADLKKADMIEEEYKRRLDKQTAMLLLAEIIEDLKVEVVLMTEATA